MSEQLYWNVVISVSAGIVGFIVLYHWETIWNYLLETKEAGKE